MVISNPEGTMAANANNLAHPSGIPQEKIDNIMSGISNTGDVKMNNHRKKLRQRYKMNCNFYFFFFFFSNLA